MRASIKIIIILLFTSTLTFAQKGKKGKTTEKPADVIYSTVDVKAVYVDGDAALKDFISKNISLPATLKESTTVLKCPVKLTIDEVGKITDAVNETASSCLDCDAEALKVTKNLKNFTPAKLKGKAVKSYLVVNVDFIKAPAAEDPESATSRKKKMIWD